MTRDDIIHGRIKWDYQDLKEVNVHLFKLMQKPKDDWDLSPTDLPVDQFHPIGQVSKYMQEKYSEDLYRAHLIRYNNILRFLREYSVELEKKGYLKESKPYPLIKDEVLQSLCELNFTEFCINSQGYEEYVFSFEDILHRADELSAG